MSDKPVGDKLKEARKLKAEAFSYSASLLAKTAALEAAGRDLATLANEVTRLQNQLGKAWRWQLLLFGIGVIAGAVLVMGIWESVNQ